MPFSWYFLSASWVTLEYIVQYTLVSVYETNPLKAPIQGHPRGQVPERQVRFIFASFGLPRCPGVFAGGGIIPNCIELERSGEAQLLNLAYKVELGPIVMQTKPH
ncbi:hypothetical protein PCH_Pc13g01440 [Penicillium rubens Wisconsin 54-1255]|uniref:Uncharacterized protein n=1 Tax=Penicillium rubens (strain ATCC 28089 / DSM 1075 / NRRL 1951 / Wisconsin 54-1255) TaxID=500485 RepID=B6H1Q9_PENRW|nr:hypothetical protein PCH_Pc13g01440 [Penicillium rubens Wisconsin 54-1255]